MAKFKVGDEVRHKRTGRKKVIRGLPGVEAYDSMQFSSASKGMSFVPIGWGFQKDYELVTAASNNKEDKVRNRKLYRLRKDSLEHSKGLVVMENCKDGTQDFTEVPQPHHEEGHMAVRIPRTLLEKTGWWEEVTMQFVTVAKTKPVTKKAKSYK